MENDFRQPVLLMTLIMAEPTGKQEQRPADLQVVM
jgi:hypothetical protein